MKRSILSILVISLLTTTAYGSLTAVNSLASVNATVNDSEVQAKLDAAKKAGKAVFVIVTGTGITDTEKATAVAKGANSIYKNAIIVQMNRDDAANTQLVSKWRVAGAPLPLILVLSAKGLVAGGYTLDEATAKNIAELVPSPKLEAVYEANGNGKHTIVVFTKKSFADRASALKIAQDAVNKLNNKAVLVEVDIDDNKESGFMKQFQIDKLTTKNSTTVVINKDGQVAGTSTNVTDANKLVLEATTPVSSGCGSGCSTCK